MRPIDDVEAFAHDDFCGTRILGRRDLWCAVVLRQYFMKGSISADNPRAITHLK